jgi:hypothetical protein
MNVTKLFAVTLLFSAMILFGAASASAADRVQAGQWETKLTGATPQPMVTKYCITPAEAKLMNGDLATLRKYLVESTAEKTKGRCSVKNVALNGNRTVVTMVCGKSEVVGTTTYHGDHYESTSSNGTTVTGKRLGGCPAR